VLLKNAVTELVGLALKDDREPGPLESQIETANSGEERGVPEDDAFRIPTVAHAFIAFRMILSMLPSLEHWQLQITSGRQPACRNRCRVLLSRATFRSNLRFQ